MKTNVVYVVISEQKDIYFEQVWASAWSLKYHNPDTLITLLTDGATKETIYTDGRKEALKIIDKVVVVDFDVNYTNMEKSRWIKTNMRQLISPFTAI